MPNPVRSSTGSYKNQPGRIENYVPGHSSVSDKEKKEVRLFVCMTALCSVCMSPCPV